MFEHNYGYFLYLTVSRSGNTLPAECDRNYTADYSKVSSEVLPLSSSLSGSSRSTARTRHLQVR